MSSLLIVGDGGQGRVVLDTVLEYYDYEKVSFLVNYYPENKISGFDYYIEKEVELQELLKEFDVAIVALGDNITRFKKATELKKKGFSLATIIHPTAFISKTAKVGEGTYIGANAVINTNASVGKNCIINTSAIIEHDCIIGDNVHISPNVALGGTTQIGDLSWICIGACIINNIVIGSNVVVAAGSSVINNFKSDVMVAGAPAIVKKNRKNLFD